MSIVATVPPRTVLADLLAARGTAIMAHRGTPGVTVVENTARAAITAVLSGADIIELDVTGSTDGAYFAFHDGEEKRLLGHDVHLLEMTAAEIRECAFTRVSTVARAARIETIEEILTGLWNRFPDTLVNLDRSWTHWPHFFSHLDRFDRADQLILKSPVSGGHWQHLQHHPVKYPYVGICRTVAEAEIALAQTEVNVIGVELLATSATSPFLDPVVLDALRERGAILIANAEVLIGGADLFAGHDDDEALFGTGPGWSRLLNLGFDVIQTDWPWLLRHAIDAHHSTPRQGVPSPERQR